MDNTAQNNGKEEGVTQKIRNAIAESIANGKRREVIEKATEREIEQVHVLSKWNLGIISAMILLMMSWLWSITSERDEIQKELQKFIFANSVNETTMAHLREHADKTEVFLEKHKTIAEMFDKRLSDVEDQISKGPRYTAADGERDRNDRIKADEALSKRLDLLEYRLNLVDKKGTR